MINETVAIGTSLANGTTNDTVPLECGEIVTRCGCYDAEYARISETLQVILKTSINIQKLKFLNIQMLLKESTLIYLHYILQWWCEGVLFFGVGLIALVFNTLSIGILATEELRKHTFNQVGL